MIDQIFKDTKKRDKKWCQKISIAKMGHKHSQKTIEKIKKKALKRNKNPDFIKKISDAHKGYKMPIEQKEKISQALKKIPFTNKKKKQLEEARKKRKFDLDTRVKMSKASKKKWKNKEYREHMLKNNKGLFRKGTVQPYTYINRVVPNKLEEKVLTIVPSCVKYVGNGKLWISVINGNKNPDFVVRPFSETKKIIEVFGDYWHKKKEEKSIIETYQQVGIKCMIVWEHEIHENIRDVQEKINCFTDYKQGGNSC